MMNETDNDFLPYYIGNNLRERSTVSQKSRQNLAFDMRRESDSRRILKQRPVSSPLNRNEPADNMSDLIINTTKKKLLMSKPPIAVVNQDIYYGNNVDPDVAIDMVITESNSV